MADRTPMFRLPALVLLALLLATCGRPTVVMTPVPTPPLATTVPGAQQITIDLPTNGTTVGSPFELRGRIATYPTTGQLAFRIFDARGTQVGGGTMQVAGGPGQPGAFAVQGAYSAVQSGPARIEVIDIDAASGAVRGIAAVPVNLLTTGAPAGTPALPTPLPVLPTTPPQVLPTVAPLPTAAPAAQQIVIDSPPPGTLVGSPLTIVGRTSRYPTQGGLTYRFIDDAGRQIGTGRVPVNGQPGTQGQFTASLAFTLPLNGGVVRVELLEQDTAGTVTANAALELRVAPPQAITIDTPAAGTQVGSPVTLTGRLARYPFQGNLAYVVTNAANATIGQGLVNVTGALGQPATFAASLTFTPPADGGQIRVTLADEDGTSGVVAASAAINLVVAPQAQRITIGSPAAGTAVGSPVTLTGSTTRYPFQGNLGYRVLGANSTQLGAGAFPVNAQVGRGGPFVASLTFALPSAGGPITIELFDQDAGTGTTAATASVNLVVSAPVPVTVGPVIEQRVIIETPRADDLVPGQFTVAGRTVNPPNRSQLSWQLLDQSGLPLLSGIFTTTPQTSGRGAIFSGTVAVPAGSSAVLTLVISDVNNAGQTLGSGRVQVRTSQR